MAKWSRRRSCHERSSGTRCKAPASHNEAIWRDGESEASGCQEVIIDDADWIRSSSSHLGSAVRSEDGKMVAKYFISEAVSKSTYTYRRVGLDDSSIRPGETAWYAYVEGNPPSAWYNSQTYIDTLNPKAIQRFIELTHEKYKATVGEEFGTTVPSIFCDEPQFSHKVGYLVYAGGDFADT